MFKKLWSIIAIVAATVTVAHCQSLNNVVATGSCVGSLDNGASNERCAMQSNDCEPTHVEGNKNVYGERWYSAYRQTQRGNKSPCSCTGTAVGACIQASAAEGTSQQSALALRCAAHEGLCTAEETFIDATEDTARLANCQCDRGGIDFQPTQYGACVHRQRANDYFCSYQSRDCPDDYEYLGPSVIPYDCHCGNVRIGGCVGGFMKFQCAVTTDDCTFDEYFGPVELEATHGYQCRLCDTTNSAALQQPRAKRVVSIVFSVAAAILGIALVMGYCCKKQKLAGKEVDRTEEEPSVELKDLEESNKIT